MSSIRRKAIEGFKPGDALSISRTFTERDMIDFARITKDYNPVHFDDRFAKAKNFSNRICHGLLVAGMLTEIGGQIGWLASGMNFDFKRPVYVGDTITCYFTITDIDERGKANAAVLFKDQNEEIVIEASLAGILPGSREKKVMTEMMAEGDPTNQAG
jgi:acyl dehydratase